MRDFSHCDKRRREREEDGGQDGSPDDGFEEAVPSRTSFWRPTEAGSEDDDDEGAARTASWRAAEECIQDDDVEGGSKAAAWGSV